MDIPLVGRLQPHGLHCAAAVDVGVLTRLVVRAWIADWEATVTSIIILKCMLNLYVNNLPGKCSQQLKVISISLVEGYLSCRRTQLQLQIWKERKLPILDKPATIMLTDGPHFYQLSSIKETRTIKIIKYVEIFSEKWSPNMLYNRGYIFGTYSANKM